MSGEEVIELGPGQRALRPQPFFECLTSFLTGVSGDGRRQNAKRTCNVRVVDTMLVADGVVTGMLMYEGDIITQRKVVDPVDTVQTWMRTAHHGPVTASHLAAVLRNEDNSVSVLDMEACERFCHSLRAGAGLEGLAAMQKFVASRGGDRSVYRVEYSYPLHGRLSIGNIARYQEFLSPETNGGRAEFMPVPSYNPPINSAIETATTRLLAHIEERLKVHCTRAILEFIIDDRERAWFAWPRAVLVVDMGEASVTSTLQEQGIAPARAPPPGDTTGTGTWMPPTLELGLHASLPADDGVAPPDAAQKDYQRIVGATIGAPDNGHLLLVDDDATAAMHALQVLRDAGYAITVTNDGPRALALTRTRAFDCLIINRDLPTFSGLEVTRIVRQREAANIQREGLDPATMDPADLADLRLPILAFTHKCEPEDLRLYKEAGMNGCVTKPVIEESLLRIVEAAVPGPRRSKRGRIVPPTPGTGSKPPSPMGARELNFSARAGFAGGAAGASPLLPPISAPPTASGMPMPQISPLATVAAQELSARQARAGPTSAGIRNQGGADPSPYAQALPLPASHVSRGIAQTGKLVHSASTKLRDTPAFSRGMVASPDATGSPPPTGSKHALALTLSDAAKRPVTGGIHGGRVGEGAGLPHSSGGAQSVSAATFQKGGVTEDTITGVFRLDVDTEMPYCALGVDQPGAAFFHMVIVNDIFDTFERYQIFFRRMTRKLVGLRILLFNYPGQAYTRYRKDISLTNEYLAGCLQALLVHLGADGNAIFTLDGGTAPFYIVGYGFGASIASVFAAQYLDAYPHMRGLVHVNGFSYVDSHLAGVLHDCVNVFSCAPPQRPDLPVYFHARFLFSPAYLAKVGAALALNIYTAVANPISLDGRIALCQGALASINVQPLLAKLDLPLVLVSATKDGFVRPVQASSLASARGGEARSIRRALFSRRNAAVVSLLCGHEVWQEAKAAMLTLLYQLATGYHERNDVAFLPLDDADVAALLDDEDRRALETTAVRLVTDPATMSLSRPMGAHARQELEDRAQANLAPPAPMLEDRFLDHVVTTMRDPSFLAQYAPPSKRGPTTTMLSSSGRGSPGQGGTGSPTMAATNAPASEGMGLSEESKAGQNPRTHPTSSNILASLLPGLGIGVTTLKSARPPADPPSPVMKLSNTRALAPQLGAGGVVKPIPPLKRLDGTEVNQVTAAMARRKPGDTSQLRVSRALLRGAPNTATPGTGTRDARTKSSTRATAGAAGAAKPELQEYMAWRIRRNQKRLYRLEGAAIVIQRAFRAYLSRSAVQRVIQTRAALDIQSWWRGELARRYVAELRRVMNAIITVQRVYRGHRARIMVHRMRLEVKAAVTVQKVFRGFLVRRYVEHLKRHLHVAATKIQSAYRRFSAIKELVRRRIERVAAITIQRVGRGFLGRRRATRERDRFLFSKSQAQGIEFGRQLLMEHKLHATRLQSEVAVLTREKVTAEESIQAVLAEIATFEQGVRGLERDMLQLAQADSEITSVIDDAARTELREQKLRLDREFARLLAKISDRKERLTALESKLQALERAREAKRTDLKELERKLVILLDQQHVELTAIRRRQEVRGEHLIEDAVAAVTQAMTGGTSDEGAAILGQGGLLALEDAPAGGNGAIVPLGNGGEGALVAGATQRSGAAGTMRFEDLPDAAGARTGGIKDRARGGPHAAGGPTPQQRAEAAALMASTETMMKFGFMSMSLTYFSAMNMVRAMRTVGTANTLIASEPMLQLVGQIGAAGIQGALPLPPPGLASSLTSTAGGASGAEMKAPLRPGQLPGQETTDVAFWTVGDVCAWLDALALGQYKDAFADAAIDGAFLMELTEDDLLNTLGVEHALHRKKIINAIIKLQQQRMAAAAAASVAAAPVSMPLAAAGAPPGLLMPAASTASVLGPSLSIDTALVQSTYQPSSPPRYTAGMNPALAASTMVPNSIMVAPVAASGSLQEREQQRAEEARLREQAKDGAAIKLDEMMSWIRNNKGKQVAEALAPLPDARFDRRLVKTPFIPGFGTEYIDRLNTPAFHINKTDDHGNTLLMIACQNGRMKMAQLLVRKGANPNHQNQIGNTAAHFAYTYKFWDLAAWLMDPDKGGADDTITNEAGNTPYDGLD